MKKIIAALLAASCLMVLVVGSADAYLFTAYDRGAETSSLGSGEANKAEPGWNLLAVADEGEAETKPASAQGSGETSPIAAVAFRQQFTFGFNSGRLQASVVCGTVSETKLTFCVQREKDGEVIAVLSQSYSEGIQTLVVESKETLTVQQKEYFKIILLVEQGGAVIAKPPVLKATNRTPQGGREWLNK